MVLYSHADPLLHAARAAPFPSRHLYNVVDQHLRTLPPKDLMYLTQTIPTHQEQQDKPGGRPRAAAGT